MLSQYARPGTPLYRILQRRLASASTSGYMSPSAYGSTPERSAYSATSHPTGSPIRSGAFQGGPMNPARATTGTYGSPSMGSDRPIPPPNMPTSRYTGMGSTGGGGSNYGVMRGDFQGGGFPQGGNLHLSPTTNLSPGLRFGRAVTTQNGYDVTHPSIPGMINSATRLRGTSTNSSVGQRGPW
jgi:hypothetical protein